MSCGVSEAVCVDKKCGKGREGARKRERQGTEGEKKERKREATTPKGATHLELLDRELLLVLRHLVRVPLER